MKTITFYSYKGGVGRSLALSNIAARLSELKKKVCVIDFDLEAPGLHFKFKNYINTRNIELGLVDYIYEFACENILHKSIQQYTYKLNPTHANYEPLYFIPAGNINSSNYWKNLSKIRWSDLFYEKDSLGLRFFLDLKMKIESEITPDFLLIDSRTGITDISGITLRVLADEVVILSAFNEESLFGSKRIIKNLYNSEESLFNKSLKVNFVLSRIPFSNDIKDREKEAAIKRKVQREFEKELGITDFQVSLIHSDRSLEENEKHLIGYEINDNSISISNDYLSLFSLLTEDILTKDEMFILANIKKAELEYKKAANESNILKKIEYLSKAIELDASNSEYYFEIGNILYETKDYDKALVNFLKAKELNSNVAHYYLALSVVYRKEGELQKSLDEINTAIRLNPRYSDFYIQKTIVLKEIGDLDQALSVLNEALDAEPNNSRLLNTRADLFRNMDRYKEALNDIYKAIEINSENPIYFGTLAEIFGALGKVNEFYLNLSIALTRGIKASELISAKDVYEKYQKESKLRELLEKYNISVEEILEQNSSN